MVGWYIGLLGIVIGLVGGIVFLKTSSKIRQPLKEAINYLVAASLIYVLFSGIMIILVLMGKNDMSTLIWQSVPILFTLSSILFAFGSIKLIKILNFVKHLVVKS